PPRTKNNPKEGQPPSTPPPPPPRGGEDQVPESRPRHRLRSWQDVRPWPKGPAGAWPGLPPRLRGRPAATRPAAAEDRRLPQSLQEDLRSRQPDKAESIRRRRRGRTGGLLRVVDRPLRH